MKKNFYSFFTIIILLNGFWLNAQTTCQVTAPAAGSSWVAGATMPIQWNTTAFTTNVNLVLFDISIGSSGQAILNIASNIPNSGSFNFIIPNTLPSKCSYGVYIENVVRTNWCYGPSNICIRKSNCDASFSFAPIGNCGNFQFTNTSVVPGLDRPGYSWNFGDPNSGANNTSTAQHPTHQFSACGTYNVCTTVSGSGCTATICNTVTVSDITPPVARCKQGIGVILDANCQYNVTSAFVDNGSTDNCQIKSLVVNPAIIFGCANTTVTLTVTDWCNNRSTCTMGIQTIETVPPTIVCPPTATVTCTTDTIPSVTGTATATDNCPGTITFTRSDVVSGNMPCDATIRRTWTATDACGNKATCTQIIAVRDNVKPTVTCPPNVSVQCGATTPSVTGTATATDNCSTPTVAFADVVTGTLPCNTTIRRTWTARDGCGNTATCVQTITVNDNTPPTIVCPQSYTVNTNAGQCYFTGTLTLPTATDNCDQSVDIVCSLLGATSTTLISSTTQFPKGVNNISCIAQDDCGNGSTVCNFTLTVVDREKPTITCPLSISVVGSITPPSTVCKALINGIAPTVTDNCPMVNTIYSIASVTNGTTGSGNNDASGTNFMGTSSVTYTATDMAGNTSSCSFTINVKCVPCLAAFTYAASGNCNNIQFTNQSSGTPPLTYVWTFGDIPSGSNNTSTAQNPAHTFTGCGTYNVCLYLTTSDGCRDSLCRQITIDNTVPTMTCPANMTVMCTKDTVTTITGKPTVTDNCPGTVSLSYTDVITGTLPCNGTVKRTWTARDACGNTTTCVQTITVNDNTRPTIVCTQSFTVNTNQGVCYYTGILPKPTGTDNCDQNLEFVCSLVTPTGSVVIVDLTQFPKGVNTISCFARDDCGNVSATCTYTLTVVDNQKPTITCPLSITVAGSITPPSTLCKAIVNGLAPTVTDNCPMTNVSFNITPSANATPSSGINNASGTSFTGTSTVVYTVTDMGGNTATCSFSINVRCDSTTNSIFKCGQAVVSCFSGFISGAGAIANPTGPVLAIVDIRNHITAPLGMNWPTVGLFHDPTWDAQHMGQIFGVTIDNNYNVYAASSTIYGKYLPTGMPNTAFGNVYRVNSSGGAPIVFATLPQNVANPAGLGDVWFDAPNSQFFVSNFFDGKIYCLDMSGAIKTTYTYDFPGTALGAPSPGFIARGERVWAVATHQNRLYFSVWVEDRSRVEVGQQNCIYSIGLNGTGKPTGAAIPEITLPPFLTNVWSSPVSDITFSSSGKMLVSERSMNNDFGNAYTGVGAQAHASRILEFSGAGWSAPVKTLYVGNVAGPNFPNSAGGIDYGYESFNPSTNPWPTLCDSTVWGTGDALRFPGQNSIIDGSTWACGGGTSDYVYGLTGVRSSGNSNVPGPLYVKDKSIYIDLDHNLCSGEKTQIGDVDIFKNCINCGNPTPQYPCDSLMVMVNSIASPVPNQCCYSVSLKNLKGNITKICANLPTANWVFNTSMVTTAGYNLQLIGSNTLCITHTSGSIPLGNLPNVFKFCLAETQPNAVSPQLVTFDWFVGMNIVCRDSFRTECRPPVAKDTCLIITELSANCFGENDLEYCMTFQVKNISGAPAYGLVLQNLPPGFTFGNCGCGGNLYGANGWLFDWLATPLANNATRTVCVKIISTTPILSPKNVCFNATLDIAPNCCTAPKDWCVTLKPCCNPCEKISVAVNNRDSCCYSLDFKYDCDYQVFTKIEFDILTPGVSFGSHAHNAAWSLCNVPTLTNVCILPPLGTMPSGVFNNLFSFCLTDINSPLEIPQQVKIKYWMLGSNGQDSLACDTILRFNCGYTQKPCVFITDEKIECIKDSMKYKITVTVKNLSSPSFTAYSLMFIGSGLTPNPVPLIPPLPNDGTVRTVTFCYTPTPWPDADGLLYLSYRLKDLEGDTCCNGNQTLIDTLVLPSCDTCKCSRTSFSGLNYRPTQGAQQRFISCGDILIANCASPTFNWTLGGNFQCMGDSCPALIQMSWILRGPPGSGVLNQTGTMSGPNFSISIPTSYYSKAGNYTLELRGICGRDTCKCSFVIKAEGCPCCQDVNIFNQNIANFISVTANNALCKATVNIGNLPNCDVISSIQWGDNTNSAGPFTANSMPMHTYSGSGTYIISFLAIERNPLTGLICFEYQRRDTIRLMCTPSDTCQCRGFETMSFFNDTWAQPLSKTAKCDSSYTLPCTPIGSTFYFHGNFLCSSRACMPDSVSFSIAQGITKITSGTVVLNSFGSGGHFDIILNPALFTAGVPYTITVTGKCGNQICTCKVNFTFAPCGCLCETLVSDVKKGFKTLGTTIIGCKKTIMPMGLCPNDVVNWTVASNNVITTTGNASITLTFTSSGVYYVCMNVSRFNANGTLCGKSTYCQNITVICPLPVPLPDVTHCRKNGINGNAVKNGDFTEGALEGHLGFGGAVQNWTLFPNVGDGFIMVDKNTGASDGGHLMLNANNANRAGVFQQITLPISTFTVVEYYARNYSGASLPAGTVLEFRLYNEPIAGSPSQLIYSDTIPKDSLAWMRRTFSPRISPDQTKRFFNICLSNNGTTAQSTIGIDNIEMCSSATVDTKEATVSGQFQIVPNPNQGTFTVVLSERATLGMKLRILNSIGQVVQDFTTKLNNEEQTIQAHHLPNGMYFLQVVLDGKVIGVEKFVKQ